MPQGDWRTQVEEAFRQKDWDQGEEICRGVLNENNKVAQAWVFLGEALEKKGQGAAAWQCFDRGWMLDPPAAWAPAAESRLQDKRTGPIPDWLNTLLQVPPVRVMGAIVARDEEDNIGRCIQALKPAVDGIVVVDTGSVDNTVAIAEAEGARVVRVEWNDDFGKARRAADEALGDSGWVLWVDADEFLQADDVEVPRIAAGLFNDMDPVMLLRIVQVNYIGGDVQPNYDTTRMFPLGRGWSWGGRIHEQVVHENGRQVPMQRGAARIRLDHWGYEADVMSRRQKVERNVRLLEKWVEDEPQNPAAWGFLGRDLYIGGQYERAIAALSRAEVVAASDPVYGRLSEVRAVLCEALVKVNRLDEARAVAERVTTADPAFPTGWYWRGQVALLQADQLLKEATSAARKAQELAPRYRGLVSVPSNIPNLLAPLTLADATKMQGQWIGSLDMYRQLAQKAPDHAGIQQQITWITQQVEGVAKKGF